MTEPRSLRFELAPSRPFAALIVTLHAAAALCAVLVTPGAAGALLGGALLALGLAAAWGRALLRSSVSVRAIEPDGPASAVVELANGARFVAEVGVRRYVSRFIVNVPLKRPVRRTILVTGDMLTADSFRRLRIWALWGEPGAVAGKQLPG